MGKYLPCLKETPALWNDPECIYPSGGDRTQKEICRYNLTDSYPDMTAVIFGEVYRHNGEWKFGAIGQGTKDPGLGELSERYQ